jgi:hypothetical protein
MKERFDQIKTSGTRVFAVVGIATALAVGSYGVYLGYSAVRDSDFNLLAAISGLFTSPVEEEIAFGAAYELVNHDEPFTLTWSHVGKTGDGSYTFFHECQNGISFSLAPQDASREEILCGEYSAVSTNKMSIRLVTSSTEEQFVDVPISIMFKEDEGVEEIRGGIIVTIINNNLIRRAQNGNTPIVSGVIRGEETDQQFQFGGDSNPATSTEINPNGKPDLEARFIASGYIEVGTNEFFATSTIPRGKRAAVRFDVVNVGDNVSGSWTFNAALPTSPHHIFHAETQTSLKPSERVEFTLGFDRITGDTAGTVIVTADPADGINESDEENNILEIELSIESFN